MSNIHLSEEVRNRIKAEEAEDSFREEVRRERRLASSNKCSRLLSAIWKGLNSQFGGWVLSTLLVGGAVFLYGEWKDYLAREATRAAQRERIADEIAFRLQSYQRERNAEKPDSERCRKALDGAYPPHFIYPDLANRTIVSLVWELARLCDKTKEKQEFRLDAKIFCDFSGSQSDANALDRQVQSLARRITELLPSEHNALLPLP